MRILMLGVGSLSAAITPLQLVGLSVPSATGGVSGPQFLPLLGVG